MKIRDMNHLVLKNLQNNRSRTAMTIMATAIACSFLILLASFGFGVQETIIRGILAESELNQIAIFGREQEQADELEQNGNENGITISDIEKIEQMEHVQAVTRSRQLNNDPVFVFNETETALQTGSVHFSSEKDSGRKLVSGRLPENKQEIVMDQNLPQTSQGAHPSIGEEERANQGEANQEHDNVTINPTSLVGENINMHIESDTAQEAVQETFNLQVVGVFESSELAGMQMGPPGSPLNTNFGVYITEALAEEVEARDTSPLEQAVDQQIADELTLFLQEIIQFLLELSGQGMDEDMDQFWAMMGDAGHGYDNVNVFADSIENVEALNENLQDAGYRSFSIAGMIDNFSFYFQFLNLGMIMVGAIGVIIASIGIYNTMSMAVSERAQEIGIMKAIGTHPKTVKRIFLMESIYIGVIGATIGIFIAFVLSRMINWILPLIVEGIFQAEMPEIVQLSYIAPSLIIISFLLCAVVAIVSGMKPAVKATKVQVLQALRRDL